MGDGGSGALVEQVLVGVAPVKAAAAAHSLGALEARVGSAVAVGVVA